MLTMTTSARLHATLWLGLLAFVSSSPAMAQASTAEGFQGLPWGASVQVIQERFSNAQDHVFEQCSVAVEAQRWRERNTSCKALTIAEYRITTLAFTGTFFLTDREQALKSVALETTVQMDPNTPHLRPELMAKCGALRNLLNERYGDGEWLSASSTSAVFLQRTRWLAGSTVVDLDCRAVDNSLSMTISYAPKVDLDAMKL